MTPLFCPAQALVLFWLHKLVQGVNPCGRGNKYSHCLRPFQQQTHYICSGKSWKTTWSVQLRRKKFCLEGAMCAICSPFTGELPKELRHQGQTSAPSLKGTAHNWRCLESSSPPHHPNLGLLEPPGASGLHRTTRGFCDSDRNFAGLPIISTVPLLWHTFCTAETSPTTYICAWAGIIFSYGNFMFWSFHLG